MEAVYCSWSRSCTINQQTSNSTTKFLERQVIAVLGEALKYLLETNDMSAFPYDENILTSRKINLHIEIII